MEKLLALHPTITAVFCSSDLMALGALNVLEKQAAPFPDLYLSSDTTISRSLHTAPLN